jgi:3-hydroxyisobutyrate dehydrogenase-like beta-hydroxyacid dehydrogenase
MGVRGRRRRGCQPRCDSGVLGGDGGAAGEVARAAARYLRPGQILLDVNSASPRTKQTAAELVEASGADYVEGAVMAAVAGPGLKVPILAGGRAATRAADMLNGLGMNMTPVAHEVGRASATKLARSIVMKGIEAALIQSIEAARCWNVEREVLHSLQHTYPAMSWATLVQSCSSAWPSTGNAARRRCSRPARCCASWGSIPGCVARSPRRRHRAPSHDVRAPRHGRQ